MFEFENFRFEPDVLALYYRDEIVKGAERQSLRVLGAILERKGHFATHDEIIRAVWADSKYGVDPSRVNQHISKLQKVFARYESETQFFENLHGRGYRLIPLVTVNAPEAIPLSAESEIQAEQPSSQNLSRRGVWFAAAVAAVVLGGAAIIGWRAFSVDEADKVRSVVKESQMFESLVLYKNPERFQETDLDKYWTAELDIPHNPDRGRIKQAVQKMVAEGRRYGDETRCDQFEFQTVDVNVDGDQAAVRTLETWQIANYKTDGTPLKISTVGPYFVDYTVRKVDGRWLIEKSTTARTVRPTPRLDSIDRLTEPVAGTEFRVNVKGGDFEPMTVFVEIIGIGCPDVKPCKIDNGTLRKTSKLSSTALESVPLTLASGKFKMIARNGDSKPSNGLDIIVP